LLIQPAAKPAEHMNHVKTPTATVTVGQHQIAIELPIGTTFGDPGTRAELAKNIADGLLAAYQTYPPAASV
jgi:hypothetical protein